MIVNPKEMGAIAAHKKHSHRQPLIAILLLIGSILAFWTNLAGQQCSMPVIDAKPLSNCNKRQLSIKVLSVWAHTRQVSPNLSLKRPYIKNKKEWWSLKTTFSQKKLIKVGSLKELTEPSCPKSELVHKFYRNELLRVFIKIRAAERITCIHRCNRWSKCKGMHHQGKTRCHQDRDRSVWITKWILRLTWEKVRA